MTVEDALRVLRECLKLRSRILAEVATELPHLRTAIKWPHHCPNTTDIRDSASYDRFELGPLPPAMPAS